MVNSSGGYAIIIEASVRQPHRELRAIHKGVSHHPAKGDVAESMGDQRRQSDWTVWCITSSRIDDIDLAQSRFMVQAHAPAKATSDNNNAEVYYELLLPELLMGPLETATTADSAD